MKRKIILGVVLILFLISFASAGVFDDFWNKITGQAIADNSVSNTLSEMISSIDSYDDISIVYGDAAAIEDLFGAFMVSDILPVFNEDKPRSLYVKKASEIMLTTYQNKNLILIGGPCANVISEIITNEEGYNCDDWKFDYGESLVKIFDNRDGKIIMIAGTTKGDTLKMSDAIRRYDKSYKLSSSDEVVFDTPVESECGNDICETKETDENCLEDCSDEGSFQLTHDLIVKTLDVSGDYVTYYAGDVYLQNLKTKELKKIGQGSWPQIDGDYIVYVSTDEVFNNVTGTYVEWPIIKLYKISTGKITPITEAEIRVYYAFPIIFGNNVVWHEYTEKYEDRNKPHKLMIYDIASKSKRELVKINQHQDQNFKIYGNKIVYEGPKYCEPEYCIGNAEEGDHDIWLYDIGTDKKTRITSNEEYQGLPEIWNNYLVWVDDRSIAEGNKGIYMYNILTGEEKPLNLTYAVSGGHTAISFSDYNVIWTDYRNSDETSTNEDVYFYNIQGDTERRITFNSDHQGGGKLDGNYVVWIDTRNNGQDLFMKDLSSDSILKGSYCSLNQLEQKICTYQNIDYLIKRKIGCDIEISYEGINEKFSLEPLSQKTLQNDIKIRKDARPCNSDEVVFEFI